MCFSHFSLVVNVLLRGFKISTAFFLKPYLQWNPITLQMKCQKKHKRLWILFLFLFHSRNRLIVAVSYNLWISADHRCRLVSWGVFLIKRQMSGGGRFALWHYKKLAPFQDIMFAMLSPTLERNTGCKEQHISPKLLTETGEPIVAIVCKTFPPHACAATSDFVVKKGARAGLVSKKQYNDC